MKELALRLTAAIGDRYRVELGAGGVATMSPPEDVEHHRKVAITVLRRKLAAALGAECFLHEIRLVAVPVTGAPFLVFGQPQSLFAAAGYNIYPVVRAFAPAPDGHSFPFVRPDRVRRLRR